MSRTRLAPLVILLAIGCTKPDDADPKRAAEPAKADDGGEAEAGAAMSETSTTTTTAGEPANATETDEEETGEPAPLPDSFDEIGVAVCDQYVTDFQRCIDEKVPEAERETHRRTLADNHASWLQTKKGGDSAAKGLQIGCRGAREQAKAATSTFGCEW